MKTTRLIIVRAVFVSFIILPPLWCQLPSPDNFSDALTVLQVQTQTPPVREGLLLDLDKRARAEKIILDHLNEIQKEGTVSTAIALEDYWIEVFNKAGRVDLFPEIKEQLATVLADALAPYFSGQSVDVEKFTTAAARSLKSQ
ncbi:MAG: hypothetical protein KCHDKBKB_01442 [Elusimicrobia bacterium]|nr:hypothetical protein [Elusimicrobiota bacterium]